MVKNTLAFCHDLLRGMVCDEAAVSLISRFSAADVLNHGCPSCKRRSLRTVLPPCWMPQQETHANNDNTTLILGNAANSLTWIQDRCRQASRLVPSERVAETAGCNSQSLNFFHSRMEAWYGAVEKADFGRPEVGSFHVRIMTLAITNAEFSYRTSTAGGPADSAISMNAMRCV